MRALVLPFLFLAMLSCTASKPDTTQATSSSPERIALADSVQQYVAYDQPIIALTHVQVIDGTGKPATPNQTILLQNGYIAAIGTADVLSIPDAATIIDGTGKTIIPGIVGTHNHLHMPGQPFMGYTAARLYLASGVTTIQTCGAASPQEEADLAKRIARGESLGPHILHSGPYFTGAGGNANMIIPKSEAEIRDTIRYWVNQGVRWFKVYRHTKPEDLRIIADEAHRHGAKVTGHLCSITFREAVELGIDGIEHGLNSASDFRDNKTYGVCDGGRAYMDELEMSDPRVKDLHQLMIEREVFLSSTLSIYETSIPTRGFADARTLRMMAPPLRAAYDERLAQYRNREDGEIREAYFKRIMAFEYAFFQAGGMLTAGPDPGRHNLPGFGDQRNYELFIEAGFTMEEAIKIMTSNGAQVLELPEVGTIEVGKQADLILLDGDLKQNPAVIKKVELVFKAGYGYASHLLLEEIIGKVGND